MRPNVICISRDAAFRQDFVGLEADHTIVYSNDTEDTLRLVQDHRHQVAFVSLIHPLPATESLIRQLKSISPLTQVILCAKGYVADPVSVPEVVNCIKAGALDVIEWPSFKEEITWLIQKAVTVSRQLTEISGHSVGLNSHDPAIGSITELLATRREQKLLVTPEEIKQIQSATSDSIRRERLRDILAHSESAAALTRSIQLLTIEDEPVIREEMLDFTRTSFTGFVAANTSDGLDIIRNHPIDIVFLDIGLPDVPGNKAVLMIKEIKPTIDVVMLTAFSNFELIMQALQRGATDYVVKPPDLDQLELLVIDIRQQQLLRTA